MRLKFKKQSALKFSSRINSESETIRDIID